MGRAGEECEDVSLRRLDGSGGVVAHGVGWGYREAVREVGAAGHEGGAVVRNPAGVL